jgi:hypothetical protein
MASLSLNDILMLCHRSTTIGKSHLPSMRTVDTRVCVPASWIWAATGNGTRHAQTACASDDCAAARCGMRPMTSVNHDAN